MIKPKVSILCTVYNHAPYLHQCLEGLIMQKTTFPIEVVVHDDCSTDSSAKIIRDYEQKYPDIFRCIYQQENQYSKGTNLWTDVLLPEVKSEYVAICEGDDFWVDPYKLQKQIDFLDGHREFVACFHNVRVLYPHSVRLFNALNENHTPSTEDIILRSWFIATPSLVFRNTLKEFPYWRNDVVNVDFFIELLLAKEGRFYYMDDVMAVYRQFGTGVSASLNSNKVDMYDKLIFILQSVKMCYPQQFASVFDQSISNYQHMKADCQAEMFFETHPPLKMFRLKTYKRIIRGLLKKYSDV